MRRPVRLAESQLLHRGRSFEANADQCFIHKVLNFKLVWRDFSSKLRIPEKEYEYQHSSYPANMHSQPGVMPYSTSSETNAEREHTLATDAECSDWDVSLTRQFSPAAPRNLDPHESKSGVSECRPV